MSALFKKYNFVFILTITVFCFLLTSCKKQIPDIPENVLCNGNGQTNYFPLAIGNKWSYIENGSAESFEEIIGTSTYNNKNYFNLKFTQQSTIHHLFLRMAPNGDIYSYYSDSLEFLFIPANPAIGQVICTYPIDTNISSRVVMAINEKCEIGGCIYFGVLKIQDYNQGGTAYTTYYYKKGLGLVQAVNWGSRQLDDVVLN
ncbi:MAG: hypothetical protein HY951_15005 [Bacteroidia bacterium]|nr:hypothetical protein [Bacteroidia bacterium]